MIQYFTPRPPKVAALQLHPSWTVEEWMRNLQAVPGVRSVTARITYDEITVYTVIPRKGCGEPIEIHDKHAGGWWIVAAITETIGSNRADIAVMRMLTDELQRLYQPTVIDFTVDDFSMAR